MAELEMAEREMAERETTEAVRGVWGNHDSNRDSPQASRAQRECTTPRSSRHIPAAVSRAVWERDGGRCTYVDARGQRCRETAGIEFHHVDPYCLGGAASVDNITLHCRAHNALAAQMDLGRDFVERKKTKSARTASCNSRV
jgi:5-methylcytosine-specific restriction endonuclease McrA